MKSGFSFLGDLLKGGLERTGLKGAVREREAILIWPEIVGAKTASVTRVESVREGILYVNCRDSMWAQELHFLRPIIIEKLNERLGKNVIKEIRLAGRGFSKRTGQKEEDRLEKKEDYSPSLGQKDIEIIDKAVRKVEDPNLAAKIKRALQSSRKLKKKHE
ncbi:MAG TPA: DUF721 domain-containing protein [Armatimonadota bacterium]|jgi:predicted nucleic acid-binding Zn ribbon protein|nr:DUF721 domain-containing protein [Armatimonadota bacterium]